MRIKQQCVYVLDRLAIKKSGEDFELLLATILFSTTPLLETEDKDITRNIRPSLHAAYSSLFSVFQTVESHPLVG